MTDVKMAWVIYSVVATLTAHVIGASQLTCPSDPHCRCSGSLALELNCNIDGSTVKISYLPNTYINIKCENATSLDYNKLPRCANEHESENSLKSISFKDCPLPSSSFKDVMSTIGVSKTMALIFQNAKNLTGYFDRKHFTGLQDLTKLLLSINGINQLPNNLFIDINKLTWLNIRSNTINLSEELFEPLERLETLEISHNHMTNISSNLFSHLSFLRKLSLWQSNVTWFSNDLFSGVDVLEELDLSSNGLNELPGSIFKPLRKLKKLTLFSNKFSALPHNLLNNNTELETVVILNNDIKLKELPKSFFQSLPNLKEIYIQRSGLEIMPYDVFANSSLITNISLAYNDIEELPESIFNDQINLLDLDLSYNNLLELKPKLFSSLVRLERLNLRYNSIKEIYGDTFSSLLSLMYLDMEHNKLSIIKSELFSNSKQRMSISLAYNDLDFVYPYNHSGHNIYYQKSPFFFTYNLKLLNLSHNKFSSSYYDWWHNGHENLDISYNNIRGLWDYELNEDCFKKSLNLWIAHNPLNCYCRRGKFFELFSKSKSQIMDEDELTNCKTKLTCQIETFLMALASFLGLLFYLILMIYCVSSKERVSKAVKKFVSRLSSPNESFNVVLKFSEADKAYVEQIIVPAFSCYKGMNINLEMIKSPDTNDNFTNESASDNDEDIKNKLTLLLFTPNFLNTTYTEGDPPEKIGDILDSDHTIVIYSKTGPENRLFDYLKTYRNLDTSHVWNEKKIWPDLLVQIARFYKGVEEYDEKINEALMNSAAICNDTTKLSKFSFFTLPDLYSKNCKADVKTDSRV